MDVEKVGKAISYLRKRAGYTQKDLADRIGISDKAVSKWERGLGLPDVTYLRKLSILLNTDIDSLLVGGAAHHDENWSGVIVLNDNEYKIGAATRIYDKPLINYLLSYFMLVGIRDITIVCTKTDKEYIDNTYGCGDELGIKLLTLNGILADVVESRRWHDNIMLVYGRCFLYGVDQTRFFQNAMINRDQFTMLVLPKKIKHQASRVIIDQNRKVITSDIDEQLKTQYDYYDIPILFLPSRFLMAMAREKDITSFVAHYAKEHDLYVQMLDRGFVEIEVDDWSNLQEASTFIKIVQDKCGMNVYCIEEIAWRRGMIGLNQLKRLGLKHEGTEYGDYILSLHRLLSERTKE